MCGAESGGRRGGFGNAAGYCSSKDTFFYGVKLHLIVERRPEKLPIPERAGLTPGNENDLALRCVLPPLEGGALCGDKAYCDGPLKDQLTAAMLLLALDPWLATCYILLTNTRTFTTFRVSSAGGL